MKMFGKLKLIAERAMSGKDIKFNALMHHINEENLKACYYELKKNSSGGIDGVTVLEYGRNLDGNLKALTQKIHEGNYHPQPVKRVMIPKPGKKEKRPLGIPCVEDRVVQLTVAKILGSIYEQDFLDNSYGYRPNRSSIDAVNQLDKQVMKENVNYIVEVDISKFFDNVSHYWMQRCLEERITDRRFMCLIRKFLKSGVIEDGIILKSRKGTPQGGNISPILANIYLHYVLDLWFEKRFRKQAKGVVELIRFCDDFVVCCSHEEDAKQFLEKLKERLSTFNLEVSEEKTKIIRFGRSAWIEEKCGGQRSESFDFLGFTHYVGSSRRGCFIAGHKTSKKNLNLKLQEITRWIKSVRNVFPLRIWWNKLKEKMQGHFAYFGISGNFRSLRQFYNIIFNTAFKWINRRSQKKSMTMARFKDYLERNPLPKPRIYHDLYTLSPIK